jgi:hypothetical protein
VSMQRSDYVRLVVTRVLDLTQPAPAGFWDDGRAWDRINLSTERMQVNEHTEDFLAGRTDKATFDREMAAWLQMWRSEYRDHEQGVLS